MSVYNAEPYLRAAIDSILTQDFTDFEFIIVDNASTDSSPATIASCTDPRIRFVQNPINLGPPKALNIGLKLAQGKYIARMDADDISLPSRLGRQFEYLESHPACVLLGTERHVIDEHGKRKLAPPMPFAQGDILWRLMFTSPFIHSSVMTRRDVVEKIGGYDESLRHSADYGLWAEIISRGYEARNLKEKLMLFRIHFSSDGGLAKARELIPEIQIVSHRTISTLLKLNLTPEEVGSAVRLLDYRDRCPPAEIPIAIQTIHRTAAACGPQSRRYYRKTLLRLALFAQELSLPQRISLLLKS